MSKILERYQVFLSSIKIKAPASVWITIVFIISLLFGALLFLIDTRLGLLSFAIILDLGLGIPFYLYTKYLEEIERYWPDSLRLIADTMKSGSSFDFALREATSADFGPLSNEYNEVIRRLEMGDNMSTALTHMSERLESKIIRRTITLIKECLRTGAQLSEVLENIATDTKNMYRIKKERETKTMLQIIFIFAAGAVIAPFIFGLTNVITEFLIEVSISSGIAAEGASEAAKAVKSTLGLLIDIYILIEVAAASVIVSLMRDGKISRAIITFPVMIIVSFIIYAGAQMILGGMLAGAI